MTRPTDRRTDRRPRQRLDEATRRAEILAAAEPAFAGTPYERVRLLDIAAAAGASEALIFRYFGSKAGLYAAVIEAAGAGLRARQDEARHALGEHASARDRVRAGLLVYLDHLAAGPVGWAAALMAPGTEPAAALAVRAAQRDHQAAALAALFGVGDWPRHAYAVSGYLGFLDGACLAWVRAGCPPQQRHALADAALGALEGALGDWGG